MKLAPAIAAAALDVQLPIHASQGSVSSVIRAVCDTEPSRFELFDPPYSNYFYSDCHSAAQVVVTSPLASSNPNYITPRFLVAWPAGDSGVVSFFESQDDSSGPLGISLVNASDSSNSLEPIYEASEDENPFVGVSGYLQLNTSATLTVPILGSIRSIRDYINSRRLNPSFQDSIRYSAVDDGGVFLTRLWLDNETTTSLSFTPVSENGAVAIRDTAVDFEAGTYRFNASFNYPQLEQAPPERILVPGAADESPQLVQALAFLSYSDKILAGAWRFLTYFGRDSMISLLLLEPVLASGQGSIWEGGIGAVLERINRADGSAAHEETIGDYATYVNSRNNLPSDAPVYDYKMIDTDYFLPVVLADYFVKNEAGRDRVSDFFARNATENPDNSDLTFHQLALLNAEKIMRDTAAFASSGGQVAANLIHLKSGQSVGEWRDSGSGLGGGRIPYDVNTALVPAGLRAIAALSRAGIFPEHPEWLVLADEYAQIWEDETLRFFRVSISPGEAQELVDGYITSNDFPFPSLSDTIESNVTFYGVALSGDEANSPVRVVNTDDCFRHFLLNTTNQPELSSFLRQTTDHILNSYPVGLSSDVGLFVASAAYAGSAGYARNFGRSAYHGTVVWSWQLSMMAAGLERQLGRCEDGGDVPDFCNAEELYGRVVQAYNRLWDLIEANEQNLSGEVWSWNYEEDRFAAIPLGTLNPTESNIRQLWSLTFLAVRRNDLYSVE
ncbi:hypothetical protein S40293_05585 [Stachybotrys chartarum IBT 40293]|nr:hypothetical protein S40293_05585 [Stachybotrys chartarum IBT 40293]